MIYVFLLMAYLYTSLLVAGGRGPFTLYDSFWSCHCSDLYETELEIALDSNRPVFLGVSTLFHNGDEPVDDDMCRSRVSRRSDGDEETRDICRRKLPLRYLDVLFTNVLAIPGLTLHRIVKPGYSIAFILPEWKGCPASAYPGPFLRPPIHS